MTATTPYPDPATLAFTSYFKKCIRHPRALSIARILPPWAPVRIPEFKAVAPFPEMLKLPIEEYFPRYQAILRDLNPERIWTELQGRVLLCYEGHDKWCHRHMLAKWIYDQTGNVIREYHYDLAVRVSPDQWWNPLRPSEAVAAPTVAPATSEAPATHQGALF